MKAQKKRENKPSDSITNNAKGTANSKITKPDNSQGSSEAQHFTAAKQGNNAANAPAPNAQASPFPIKKSEVVFLAKFSAIFLSLEWAINNLGFLPLQEFLAASTSALLGLESNGTLVIIGKGLGAIGSGGSFEITPSCTGLVSSSVLAAVVFSLRKPGMREKIAILAAGSAFLLVLNFFRVLAVLWFGKEFGLEAGGIAHVASWFATTIFVLALWYYFTKRITGAKDFAGFM